MGPRRAQCNHKLVGGRQETGGVLTIKEEASESWKRQGNRLFLQPPEGTQSC